MCSEEILSKVSSTWLLYFSCIAILTLNTNIFISLSAKLFKSCLPQDDNYLLKYFLGESLNICCCISGVVGGQSGGGTSVPIPNTEIKPSSDLASTEQRRLAMQSIVLLVFGSARTLLTTKLFVGEVGFAIL